MTTINEQPQQNNEAAPPPATAAIKAQFPIDAEGQVVLDVGNDLRGRRLAVLGISGSGKTNTVAVLVEGLLDAGIPLCIVDIEGEYWSLKESYQILVAGQGEHVDFRCGPEQAAALAELSLSDRLPVVLDLSEMQEGEATTFLINYFNALWSLAGKLKRPYQVIIEEAHLFIPEGGGNNTLKQLLNQVALRGRKRGLGSILVSQRAAGVSKTSLTQVDTFFLHYVKYKNDMDVYNQLVGLAPKEVQELVGGLTKGQALLLYNNTHTKITVALRKTYHPGATPELDAAVEVRLQAVDKTLLDRLAELTTAAASKDAPAQASGSTANDNSRELAELRAKLKQAETERDKYNRIAKEFMAQFENLRQRVQDALEDNPIVTSVPYAKESTPVKPAPPAPTPARQSTPPAPAPAQKSAPLAVPLRKELNRFERNRAEPVLNQVRKFSDREEEVFNILLAHPDRQFTSKELAALTGINFNDIKPVFGNLISSPLVYYRPGKAWKAQVTEYAKDKFPGVEPTVLLDLVRKALKQRGRKK